MKIQLVDLHKQYTSIKNEIDAAIANVLSRTDFIQGEDVKKFQEEFAAYCGTGLQCASCANGTDALYLTFRALGIKSGDEVITTPHTFIATAETITQVGAKPVFVDIDDKTMLMDPDRLESAITSKTKVILPVHLYGQMCDMDRIMKIAQKHKLQVVEDAAQAHGARWKGKGPGEYGIAATFSFFPGKNLGAYGDGGAVVSSNPGFIEKVRLLANHGRKDKYEHLIEGVNSRLDTLQAAILRVKLKYLNQWTAMRKNHAKSLLEHLKDLDLTLPYAHPDADPVWHLFVIRTSNRDEVLQELKAKGIQAGVHYPIPLHLQPALKHLGYKPGDFPIAERTAQEILSLPLYPELEEVEIQFMAQTLKEIHVRNSRPLLHR